MAHTNTYEQTLIDTILEVRYSNLELELTCCQKLLSEAQKSQSNWVVAFAYTYLGDYYIATNDTIQSGQYLLRAKELCLKFAFQELYMQVCHFLGIYYSLLYDEQTALQYYLDGLELTKIFKNLRLECLVLNNIAHVFQCRDAYEEAKHYYFEALERLDAVNDPQYVRQKVLVLYNLTDLFLLLKDLPMAEKYLQECEAVEVESESTRGYQRLWVCVNQCCFAALSNKRKEAVFYAEKLLAKHLDTFEDKHAISGALYPVCKAMIDLEERELSWRLLESWSKVCTLNEVFNVQRLMALKICYHDIFSGEDEQNLAYREFFHSLRQATVIESKVRTDGMKAKIYLREMLKQQEAMLQENQLLESEAHLDELTGIYNRRYINKLFSKLENDSSVSSIGIVMMDVDYFKEYNDTYGHAQGDGVLIAVAHTLTKLAGDGMFSGRYGGDEFICLCLNKENHAIEAYIEAVRSELHALSIPHEASRCTQVVTLSMGYSNTGNKEQLHHEILLEQADQALYVSKGRGRNQWSRHEGSSV